MTQLFLNRSFGRFWLAAVLVSLLGAPAAFAAKSISQFGVTWTFDRDYQTGQFANGDYWVVGPVKVTSISPKPASGMHGSMINPGVNGSQGFDSRIRNNPYSADLNVALKMPLTVKPGSSLLSSISHTTKASGDNPQLKTIAILTVLDKAAPAGSFRPPYAGTDKSLRWNKSKLNFSKLRSLPTVGNTPSLASVEKEFERPWIELKTNWTGRYMHPSENQPSYGREIAHTLGKGLLSLQLNYSNAQKETLAIRLVQYGIDVYGAGKAGARWSCDGGHNQGRKMPLLLAGTMLGDNNLLAMADTENGKRFQEDMSTWYVTKSDIGRTLYTKDGRPRVKYIQDDVGIAEWGEKHQIDPSRDGRNWDAYYRTVTGSCTLGHVLTARLMGLEKQWNWAATFDYYDRFWNNEKGNVSNAQNSIQPFVANMWKAYRGAKGGDYTPDNTSTDNIWQNESIKAQTGSFTVSFDMIASKAKMEGVTGLSTGKADAVKDLVAAVRFAPGGFIQATNGSTWQAANTLSYTAGVNYRVVISADVATDKYSVQVTPANGKTVQIANGYKFRATSKKIDNVGFVSISGAHSVQNVSLTTSGKATSPEPEPKAEDSQPKTGSSNSSVLRVNAGGSKFTDKAGRVWAADKGFDSGMTNSVSSAIAGTEDDKLFQTSRYDNAKSAQLLNYKFSLSNGNYTLRMLFAESHNSAKGKRVFDVKAEGRVVVDNLDIYKRVGKNRALTIEVPVKVSDGALNLQFVPGKGNPQINAIEVIRN